MAINDLSVPLSKFCLWLESDRRTEAGRILSATECREHFFWYDAAYASDRIMRRLPREVRASILTAWGIRGKRTALRDDDERVCAALHDAFLAGDVDDQLFEDGISAETLIEWVDLADWWSFWRSGRHTTHSLTLAFEAASDLGLIDLPWFLDAMESLDGTLRGIDVVTSAMSHEELGDWIRCIHRFGDASAIGLLEAIGWPLLVAKTPAPVLLSILDAFATKVGFVRLRSSSIHPVQELDVPVDWLTGEATELATLLSDPSSSLEPAPISSFQWTGSSRETEDEPPLFEDVILANGVTRK